MPLEGRGTSYRRKRHAVEWVLDHLYGTGWPRRLARAVGMQPRLRARMHRVDVAHWPKGVPRVRIGFASDLHAGPTTHPTLLDEAAWTLEKARLDVLLLGGDYVFLRPHGIHELAARFGRVPA